MHDPDRASASDFVYFRLGEFSAGPRHLELAEDVGDVIAHGLGADHQFAGNFWILETLGDQGQYESGARAMAEGGAVVHNANWRSKPWKAGELALMEDSACAVRFARATAADYGGDANRIVLFGHSIGGWSGSVIALAGDDFERDCEVSGFSAVPDAFVGYGGAYDAGESNPDGGASYFKERNPQLWKRIYPYELIGRNSATRFHLVVGERDEQFIPVAERFHDALKEAGYEVSLSVLEGADHEGGGEIALAGLYQIIFKAAYDLSRE